MEDMSKTVLIQSITCFVVCNVGHEGRIGMAAVTVKEGVQFDGSELYNHVISYLPSYARPRFIRIQVLSCLMHMIRIYSDV